MSRPGMVLGVVGLVLLAVLLALQLLALVRGDQTLHEKKLAKLVGRHRPAQKDEVKAVYMTVKGSRARSAGIAAVIGFIPGFALGAAAAAEVADKNSATAGERMGVGMAMGAVTAGIGAGIGAAVGGSTTKLVYRAPRRPKQG